MTDVIENRGGKREGSGRKPKEQEQTLIERLRPYEDSAFSALENAILENKDWAIKLFFQYRFGMPKQVLENNMTFNKGFPTLKQFYGEQEMEQSGE